MLEHELDSIEKNKSTQRKKREKNTIPLVSIVGYTNAGKSTLMNAFIEEYNSLNKNKTVFAKDMLFATLDTTTRYIKFKDNKEVLLSDTVGFISKLPTGLIRAFKSTLSEILNADLIVLAVYPNLVKDFIINNKEHFKDGAVITDVTGIKQLFINEITKILPENIDFVFAHPMAGREKKGIDYATNQVFKGANFLITVTDRNKDENLDLIETITIATR